MRQLLLLESETHHKIIILSNPKLWWHVNNTLHIQFSFSSNIVDSGRSKQLHTSGYLAAQQTDTFVLYIWNEVWKYDNDGRWEMMNRVGIWNLCAVGCISEMQNVELMWMWGSSF